MKDLVIEYSYGVRKLHVLDKQLKAQKEELEIMLYNNMDHLDDEAVIELQTLITKLTADRSHISAMEDGMKFAIEWMATGKRPGSNRGAERPYQKKVDPHILQRMVAKEPQVITDEKRELLEEEVADTLYFLSKREFDVMMLFYGYGFAREDIADLMDISEGNVSTYIQRARKKIIKNIPNSNILI